MTSFFLYTVRDEYKHLCERHEIQYVENDAIKTKDFPINDFAVKLKMVSSRRKVDESFKGESGRFLKDLNEATSHDINMDNLIDGKKRVTFVRGIAGIGKSVLAKQIVFGWATGTMYQNFEVCLFFECRDLNRYSHDEGEGFNSKEMLHNFIKKKTCDLNIKTEKNVLIVIDGVDELFDFGDENSLIYQFLDIKESYGKAKIIMTGRPHVENVLDKCGITIGGYKVVEMMGLGEKEIKEYIAKFTTCIEEGRSSEVSTLINKTIEASADIRPILCVPQFLNAICCVSIVTGGEGIANETELYCWTLYLFFKQHVFEREEPMSKRTWHKIFASYRQLILVVSEISFKLYSENKIIFKQKDFQPLFDGIRGDESIKPIAKGFFDGLFADKTDHKEEKLMFKHLSLMEFLSAIHVCTVKDPDDVIKRLVSNKSYEIVRYACGLYGGVFQDGIGNELYECVMDDKATAGSGDENKKEERAESFLKLALKVLSKSNALRGSIFLTSIDFIVQFFPRQFNRPSFVKSVLFQLKSISNIFIHYPDAAEERLLLRFFDIIKANAVDENSIKEALENTEISLIGKFDKFDKELLTVMKYFGKGGSILISGKNFNIDDEMMKLITDNVIYFSFLTFLDCKFNGPYFKTKQPEHYSKLKSLRLERCEFWNVSFKMFSQWAAVLSERVQLIECNGINCEMWEIFGREIDDARRHKGLKLKELRVLGRTAFDESSWAGAVRVFLTLEKIRFEYCDICEEWWRILANEVEKRANDGTLKLKKLEIDENSGINENIWQSVRKISNQIFHFGLLLSTIDCKRWYNLQFLESFLPQYSQLCLRWITFKSGITVPTNISFIYETLSLINHIC